MLTFFKKNVRIGFCVVINKGYGYGRSPIPHVLLGRSQVRLANKFPGVPSGRCPSQPCVPCRVPVRCLEPAGSQCVQRRRPQCAQGLQPRQGHAVCLCQPLLAASPSSAPSRSPSGVLLARQQPAAAVYLHLFIFSQSFRVCGRHALPVETW